jgi:hypothetical protein
MSAARLKHFGWGREGVLWISAAHIQLLDYFYYTALTVATLRERYPR